MKKEAMRHPKMYHLMDLLDIGRSTAIGLLTLLWEFTTDNSPQGDIGKWADGAIARACEWNGDSQLLIESLVAAGWLDKNAEHRLIVHDWPDHCERWVRSKLATLRLDFLPCYGGGKTRKNNASPDASTDVSTDVSTDASADASGDPSTYPNQTKPNTSTGTGTGAFAGLVEADLRDTGKMLAFTEKASQRSRPLVANTDRDQIRVLGAAERACEVGDDPVKLFTAIVFKAKWDLISGEQEDRAVKRLKQHRAQRTTGPPSTGSDLLANAYVIPDS